MLGTSLGFKNMEQKQLQIKAIEEVETPEAKIGFSVGEK